LSLSKESGSLLPRCDLPIDALNARDKIKVMIAAQEGEGMLAAERRDPQIVGGNGPTLLLEFKPNHRIGVGGLVVDVEHTDGRNPFPEPVFVTCPVPGLGDPKTVFTQDNHGNGKTISTGDNLKGGRIVVGSG
jgi:hypothetical protein